jgi:GntR family transcriptional repressor for pyruvate dehydrogenase complex
MTMQSPIGVPRSDQGQTKAARAYEQLAEVLRGRILTGELQVGDRLPSEAALAAEAGVSRSTVREALRILQEAGLVRRASPRIMVVADAAGESGFPDLRKALRRHNITFHDLHEAMMTLDPEIARLAAIRADSADLERLQEALESQARQLDDLPAWSRLDLEFHTMLTEISANPALMIAREPVSQLLLPALYRFMDTREMAEHATRYHRRIVEEIAIRDPDTAAAVMRRHINDWRTAWEKRGLNLHQEILELHDPLAGHRGIVLQPAPALSADG